MYKNLLNFLTFILVVMSSLTGCVKEETGCILFCQGDPTVSFVSSSYTISEASGTVNVSIRVSPAPVTTMNVAYQLNAGLTTATSGVDFVFNSGTLSFAPGETVKTFSFLVINDSEGGEGTETVSFSIGNPSSGLLGENSVVTYSIFDNDVADLTIPEGSSATTAVMSCDDGSGAPQIFSMINAGNAQANCVLNGNNTVTCNPSYVNDQLDWTPFQVEVQCIINATPNSITFDVTVTNTNQPPVLTSIANVTGGSPSSGVPFAITYATLSGLTVWSDADDSIAGFRIESVDDGTLLVNGSSVVAGVTTFETGDTINWTPSNSALGSTNAFKVKAIDSIGDVSTNTVQVIVDNVLQFDAPTNFNTAENTLSASYALACSNGTAAVPSYTITEGGGDLVNCSEVGGSFSCTPSYKAGQSNWSKSVDIECDLGGGITINRTVNVIVSNTNREPLLTFTDDLMTTTSAGTNVTVSRTQLYTKATTGANSLSDPDGDSPINFVVTSVNTSAGTLYKNGIEVGSGALPLPVTIGVGQNVVFTPGPNAIGEIVMFQMEATDGVLTNGAAVDVKARFTGVTQIANFSINENANFTSDFLLCDDGGAAGTVTYAISQTDADSNCSVTPNVNAHPSARVSCTPNYKTGTDATWTSDVTLSCDIDARPSVSKVFTVTVNNVNRAPTLTAIPNATGADFLTPLTITYAMLDSGDGADPDLDTISYNISSVQNGSLSKNGVGPLTTATVAVGETVVWTPATNVAGLVTMFNVRASDSSLTSASDIPMQTNIAGIYPIADIYTDEGVNFKTDPVICKNGATTATGGDLSITSQVPADSNCSIEVATGKISCTPNFVSGQGSWSATLVVQCGIAGGPYSRSVNVFVDSANQPPVITSINPISGGVINNPVTVGYTALNTQSVGLNEPDGDAYTFKVVNINTGTLTKNGTPVIAGDTVGTGEEFIWTPPADTFGSINAFTVKVSDGTLDSSTTATVSIKVAGFAPIASDTVTEGGSVTSQILSCGDGDGSTPTFTIVSESDPDSTCSLLVTDQIKCDPVYKSGSADWSSDVIVECDLGGPTYYKTYTVNVTNQNAAPTGTSISNFDIDVNTPLTINYADLLNNSDATDSDNDQLKFKIVSVSNGSMTKGGVAITPLVTEIELGEDVVWTPSADLLGPAEMMKVQVCDDNACTANITVNGNIKGFLGIADITVIENTSDVTAAFACDDGLSSAATYAVTPTTPSPNAACEVVGANNYVTCTPPYQAGQSNWSEAITVECTSGAETFTQNFTINVTNDNRAPTISSVNDLTDAVAGEVKTFLVSDILAGADEADADGDTINIRIESINSTDGTLTYNSGTAIVVGTTILTAADTLEWTPNATVSGDDIVVMNFEIHDGTDVSGSPQNLRVDNVVRFDAFANPITMTENDTGSLSDALVCNNDGTSNPPAAPEVTNITSDQAELTCSYISPNISCDAAYKDGQADWSATVSVECTVNGLAVTRDLTVDVTNLNRAPTHDPIAGLDLAGAQSEMAFSISYNDLFTQFTNAADADNDAISVEIVSINSGALTKGGSSLLAGGSVSSGETIEWTSAVGVSGSVNAFTVRLTDGLADSVTDLDVTINPVIKFDPIANISATEGVAITPVTLSCTSTNATTMTVTTVGDNGCSMNVNDLECTPAFQAGQANWSESVTVECQDSVTTDVVTRSFTLNVTNANQAPSFGVATDFTGAVVEEAITVTHADLLTNLAATDGDGDSLTFRVDSFNPANGTLVKNGATSVLAGITTIGSGDTLTWTPASTLSGDVVAFQVSVTDGSGYVGPTNATFADVLKFDAISDISVAEAATASSAVLSCSDANGATTEDASTFVQSDANLGCIWDTDKVTCTPNFVNDHTNWSATVTVTCTSSSGSTKDRVFTVNVTDTNQFSPLPIGNEISISAVGLGETTTFNFADLVTASSAVDPEGDAIRFSIDNTSVIGTLKKNGVDVAATGTTIISSGDNLSWTDDGVAAGGLPKTAFQFNIGDTNGYDAAAIDANFSIIEFATLTSPMAATEGAAASQNLTCDAGGEAVVYSIISQSDTDSSCVLDTLPDRVICTPNNKAGHSSWSSVVTIRCAVGSVYEDQSFTVSVSDTNQAPTVSYLNTLSNGAVRDSIAAEPLTLTYADLMALTDAADPDAPADKVTIRIDSVNGSNGTLYEADGITPVVTPYTLDDTTTTTVVWEAANTVIGNVNAFTITFCDDQGSPACDASTYNQFINVTVFETLSNGSVAEGGTYNSATLNCSDGTASSPIFTVTNSDATSNCALNTNKVTCTPGYKNDNLDWTPDVDVDVDCTINGKTFTRSFALTVTDTNRVPTVTTISTLTGAYSDTAYAISFADLLAASDVADLDESDLNNLQIQIVAVQNGSIDNGPAPVTITSVDSFNWTGPAGVNGDINAFTIRFIDTQAADNGSDMQVVINTSLSPAVLSASSATVSFGTVNIGATSGVTTLTINKTGDSDADITKVEFPSAFTISAQTCATVGGSITGASCTYELEYNPTANSHGYQSGTMEITYFDGYTNQTEAITLDAIGQSTSTGIAVAASGSVSTSSNPEFITVANLDNTNLDDFVVVDNGLSRIYVHLNDGSGTFSDVSISLVSAPNKAALADFDGDGYADIALTLSNGSLIVLLNDQAGGFSTMSSSTVSVDTSLFGIDTGDIDGDGDIDLVVTDIANSQLYPVFNNSTTGSLSFSAGSSAPTATLPYDVKLADLNGDGDLEAVVANYSAASIRIFGNDGDGTFTASGNVTVGTNPISLSIGDVNHDDNPDILVANFNSSNISVLEGAGSLVYSVDYNLSVGSSPSHVMLSDYNNDGFLDLMVTRRTATSSLNIWANNQAASTNFSGAATLTRNTGNNSYMTVPLSADGATDPDYFTVNYSDGDIDIYEGN